MAKGDLVVLVVAAPALALAVVVLAVSELRREQTQDGPRTSDLELLLGLGRFLLDLRQLGWTLPWTCRLLLTVAKDHPSSLAASDLWLAS